MMDLLRLENILFYIGLFGYLVSMVLFILLFVLLFVNKIEKLGKIAKNIFLIAFISHTLALVVRGINAGRIPYQTNMSLLQPSPGELRFAI